MRLQNPYLRPNPLSKPIYTSQPKPVTAGGVTVETKKPILVQPTGLVLPQPESVQTPGFWASKTKKQKTAIIISVVATVSLLTYIALKKK